MKKEDELSRIILRCAIEVHKQLGPGLLESAYEACLTYELASQRIPFVKQQGIPVAYKTIKLDCGFRADFIVADLVILELKAVDALMPIHSAQVLTYLKLTGLHLGMLLNFNGPRMSQGIKRVVLNL
jgi:GxxExxY protein